MLTERDANCQSYVAGYRSDALDVNNDLLFEGDLAISVVDDKCVFTTNLIPNHSFNDGATAFPNPVAIQTDVYSVSAAPTAAASSTALSLTAESSYQPRAGQRSSAAGNPGGSFNGAYRDDYEFIAGSGDLDACNGMTLDGVYGYSVTERFPYILGCFTGLPDSSFNK